ncbi:hypothetical protein WR25_02433 [Diploscapter pachys]|uniref:Chondroitin proteoglycan 4 domain-containing protein n=1 Tax=Diploscapter pachys TaxID=2018661 RepID=A0A2A2KKQ7_9BILA|nr:hypothetical protein WR25_02433 [Diploscapter pachys]
MFIQPHPVFVIVFCSITCVIGYVTRFKRDFMYISDANESRSCLAEAEPITFLKCDQQCHDEVVAQRRQQLASKRDSNQVFLSSNLENYEAELNQLCTFQVCYLKCYIPIVKEVCGSRADRAIDVVRSLVESHADDINDWHIVTGNYENLPSSCKSLSSRQSDSADPVLQIINAA